MKDLKDSKGRDTPKLSKTAENLKRHKSPEDTRLHKTQENLKSKGSDGFKGSKKGAEGGKSNKSKSVEHVDKYKGGDTPRKQKGGSTSKDKQTKTESSKEKPLDKSRNRTPDRKRPGSGKRATNSVTNSVAKNEDNCSEPGDNNNNMTLDDFHVVCQVGQGACGSVFLVRNLENKK